jgi:hypothetical protein
MKSVFDFDEFGDQTECVINCYNLAGGRSNLTEDMLAIVDQEDESVDSVFEDTDLDYLIDQRLISMFRRDGDNLPVIESFVVKNLLDNAAATLGGKVGVYTRTNPEKFYRSAVEFMEGVSVLEYNIPIFTEFGNQPKAGKFVPIRFRDKESGDQKTRYIEVLENVRLKFTINSLRKTDDWPMLWKVAEELGVGAARNHGYGKFVVVSWGERSEDG